MIFLSLAYFLLNVALNHEFDVIEEIKKILSNISEIEFEIQGVFGIYDIIVKISSIEDENIHRSAIEKVRSIEHIQSAIIMMVNEE